MCCESITARNRSRAVKISGGDTLNRKVFNINNLKNCLLIQRWDGDIGIIDLEYTIGTTEVIDYDFYNIPVGSNIEFIVGAGRTYEKMSENKAMVFNKHKLKEDDQSIFPLYNKEYAYSDIHKNNDLIFWDGKNLTDVMLDVCNKKIPYMCTNVCSLLLENRDGYRTVDRFDTLLSRGDTVELIDKTGFITDLTSEYDIANMLKGEEIMYFEHGPFNIVYQPRKISVRNIPF